MGRKLHEKLATEASHELLHKQEVVILRQALNDYA
jgi:hypothetical protein